MSQCQYLTSLPLSPRVHSPSLSSQAASENTQKAETACKCCPALKVVFDLLRGDGNKNGEMLLLARVFLSRFPSSSGVSKWSFGMCV